MKIKHWDPDLQEWVIDGASNASNLELSNPAYVDENGNTISVDQGFTKIANKLNKLEDNLAWIYLNGAHGGGGGGGGGGTDSITIDIQEGDTIYTSTGSVVFNLMVKNGTVARAFNITIKDVTSGKVLYTTRKYSLAWVRINITGITEDSVLEISAVDGNMNQAIPKRLSIIYGAIDLILQRVPNKTIDRGGMNDSTATFTLRNQIYRGISDFYFKVDGKTVDEVLGIEVAERSFNYSIREIIFNPDIIENPRTGQKFNFEAWATTALGTDILTSRVIKFDVTLVEADQLTIVTDGIGEEVEEATSFPQNSQLRFNYYLSYAPAKYTTFKVDYFVNLYKEGSYIREIANGTTTVSKGTDQVFSVSTVGYPITEEGEYLGIVLDAVSTSDPTDVTAMDTKTVYATIRQPMKIDLHADNRNHTLLAYYSNVTGFPTSSNTNWRYQLKKSSVTENNPFPYDDIFYDSFPNGVNLKLNKTNGTSTGFINTIGERGTIPAMVLNGESYANVEVAKQMFPNYDIGDYGFFQTKGFNISMTYRTRNVTNSSGVAMSIGRYRDGILDSGIEIGTTMARVRIGTADSLEVQLPENELITLDIDVSLLGNVGWYFKIYVNGVLSAVSRVDQSDIDWTFEEDLYIGCRNDKGKLSHYSDITVYDLKLYTSSQTEYAIVKNYISATEQASLLDGMVDESLDAELRTKNLFDAEGNCLLWNNARNEFYEGSELYNTLLSQIEVNTPYPVVMIRETSINPTNFKAYSSAIFSADDKEGIMDTTFPCSITMHNRFGMETVVTPEGVAESEGVRVGLQGTSSLSYNAKNFEIYMGKMNAAGKNQLFLPTNDWLPENQFTLKADVMDSAHVNNVTIGKIINGEVTNKQGQRIEPMGKTEPMKLPDRAFPTADGQIDPVHAESIRSRIKHTSDGFPSLVFIEYAPDQETGLRETRFMGIYNFNLGRHAHFNLGLKIIQNYEKRTESLAPTVIVDYNENTEYWNTSETEGVYSMEINQNSSSQGAFQQDARPIIEFMADSIYTSQDIPKSYNALQTYYTQVANMALGDVQKYTMDDSGQTPTKPIPGEFYTLDKNNYYNFHEFGQHGDWENLVSYYLLMILFGMVDSVTKNLTLRSWGGKVWSSAFYDMDTAFKLTNAGQEIVEYWAHLHKWRNVGAEGTGITTYTVDFNYPPDNPEGVRQYYASYWNRLWEIVENLPIVDPGEIGSRETIEEVYSRLRLNLFPDPDEFIEKYYKAYTDQTGSILFNYDYKVKYLKIAQTYTESGGYEDSTDFSQLKFLHGNRVIGVKDWFRKRVMFLDGVYGVKGNTVLIDNSIDSPVNKMWSNNKAAGSSASSLFTVTMQAPSKMLYRWGYDTTTGSYWIDNKDTVGVVPYPGGETIVSIYANKFITKFENFNRYPWTLLNTVDLPALKELDLSGLRNIKPSDFLYPTVYDGNIGLRSIEKLILSNVKFNTEDNFPYTLDVSKCDYLKYLDISNSDITSVKLPISAELKYYDLSNTAIRRLELSDQAFLETLNISGCNDLTEVIIRNCGSLKYIDLPNNVQKLTLVNCPQIEVLNLPYYSVNNSVSGLSMVNIDNCPGLKDINLSNQNNPSLDIILVGARNLEILNIAGIRTNKLLFPPLKGLEGVASFTSLRSLDISNTTITDFIYNDMPKDSNGDYIRNSYLDLVYFPNFTELRAYDNFTISEIRVHNNPDKPVRLRDQAFFGCSNLQRTKGNYSIEGMEVFKRCTSYILNDQSIYESSTMDEYLLGDSATNISINTTSLRGVFEGCSSLTYNDFRKISAQFNSRIISLEATFKQCVNISGVIWRDYFSRSRNIETLKETFSGSQLSGIIYSSPSYSSDESTWGTFDYIKNIRDAEAAFEGTMIEWIDNDLFAPKGTVSYSFLNIDYMFRNCSNLKVAKNTRAVVLEKGRLNSETFFTNLEKLLAVYPRGVFSGCRTVDMDIINKGDNTYLFHTRRNATYNVLTDSLYSGVNLIGEIKVNVFGGLSNRIEEYYIPRFTSIQKPFASSNGEISVDLSQMGNIFSSLGSSLLQAVGIFSGMTLIGSKKIPDNIFAGCILLNSIEEMFSNLPLDNDGQVYEFPNATILKDTVSLRSIRGLFRGANKLKIKLIGEGFKNCILEDVSQAFAQSSVFGVIPYRLFFMAREGKIIQSIKRMEGVFSQCWLLGYDQTREIDTSTLLENVTFEDGSSYEIRVSWSDGVASVAGNKVDYKLDMTNLSKSFNYDRDDRVEIDNPRFGEEGEPARIPNPHYNPGEFAFDVWYLDGYGMKGATSSDPDLSEYIQRMRSILDYDTFQEQSIADHNQTDWYEDTSQNYVVPTDLFRYCHSEATLEGVLRNLNWQKRSVEFDMSTGVGRVVIGTEIEGLLGRLPMKLLEAQVNNKTLTGVFNEFHFYPFYGLRGTSTVNLTRGLMYPPDLLIHNTELETMTNLFRGGSIYVGVDINKDLLYRNTKLRDISGTWSDTKFDSRNYKSDFLPEELSKNPQIDFTEICKYNNRIVNASRLFGVSDISKPNMGLRFIESTLLQNSRNLNNVSEMFYFNTDLKGAVPLFPSSIYTALIQTSGYLTGVNKANITNADQLEDKFRPESWDQ